MRNETGGGSKKLICLLCDSQFSQAVSWCSLFLLKPDDRVCQSCRNKLQIIKGAICPLCGRPQTAHEVCADCEAWKSRIDDGLRLSQNRSVYLYNDMMKETLARMKFRGDAAIISAFKNDFSSEFSAVYPDKRLVLVPIPLSEERKAERGFNQSQMLAECLNRPILNPLIRLNNEKQSKKKKTERLLSEHVFETKNSSVEGMDIVLIDDLYTTGATLHYAARCLLEKGKAGSVSSFTLVRS
ncbi:amidophosphoribosyltransferase [Bacillus halotolerans]|uniref:Amidophosphoribosyltransferase n=1 Tax=Bacillus halotolerans TaxID=260554 RepID=A0A9Q4EKM1_9BACI|nr:MULTISPECIES: amidophosphoribosyltransferase [Bacillus]MCY8472067.1 amidophosphoribosyltransferase [Bacillus halotolerans]MCY9185566.1 amidophosphoribosyltransferase [Bacillus halotolerans]MCY9200841.1 amidophosphoribosyltransferase [Bacillus halotolerans]MDP4526619.1 amidophosphoribosyltransferase [Bacillus halotolerans]MEC1648764.1 amidophosphoribosyltransferase [Bacillus halotolerans]